MSSEKGQIKNNPQASAKNSYKGMFFQPKLTINQPNDVYEQEADAVADKVMRMSARENSFFKPAITNIQRNCAHCEEEEKKAQRKENAMIQREDPPATDTPAPITPPISATATSPTTPPATTPVTIPGAGFQLPVPDLLHPRTEPDYLSMRQPFFNRGVTQLWDPNSAFQIWQYNFDFFRRLGVPPDFSATLTNLTAPLSIDSQLKTSNPTWWEITDRELNTSTRSVSLPLIQFNPNFSPVAPSWFKSIFGGGSSNVQRKTIQCDDDGLQKDQQEASMQTENYLDKIDGTGEPLKAEDKSFFESRIGRDFNNVRLHTNNEAQQSASNINALAYTHGNNIVFGAGQYQPNSESGKRLLAHELTHVAQQQGSSIMRDARPTTTADLSSYSETNRRSLLYDTDEVTVNPSLYFQPGIVETPRSGFDIDYVFAGTIATWLQPPLRGIARAIFALQSSDTDPVQLNRTLIKRFDLTQFHENNDPQRPAGPNTQFRFTVKEFDPTTAGGHRTRNVQIIIENIGAPQAIPNASETPAQRIARFQRDYNFTRVDPLLFSDNDFNRVLMAVSLIPDTILRSVSGIPFDRVVGQAVGPNNEAAEYSWTFQNNTYTRVIKIYDNALSSSTTPEALAFLMTHEIGHAVAHRPAEATGTAAQSDLSAETGRGSFQEAATTDGGLRNAITTYGRTNWGEYFAEAFSMFINQPNTLQLLRPHVYTYFTTKFPVSAAPQQTAQQPAQGAVQP